MKTNIKKSILLVAMLFFIQLVQAQETTGNKGHRLSPSERAGRWSEECKQKLSLTEQQTEQVRNLMLALETGKEKEMEERKAERKKFQDEMAKILSKEQMEGFKHLMREKKENQEQRRKEAHQE